MKKGSKGASSIAERFWSKVHIPEDQPDACWTWLAGESHNGYAKFRIGVTSPQNAHRVVYEMVRGTIPDGMQIDHLCRTRNCVRPSHLEIVTPRENLLRAPGSWCNINAGKTHCVRGHEYTPENTYTWTRKNGRSNTPPAPERQCKECSRQRQRGTI